MSLGFNLGQTGNASESGAGIVKLATAEQIANKVGQDGGVPLVATPDRLPSPTLVQDFLAGEDLVKGDFVALSQYFSETAVEFTTLGENDGQDFSLSTTTWFAQEFVFDPTWLDINAITGRLFNNVNEGWSATISIRATLDGADIVAATPSLGGTLGGQDYNIGVGTTGLLTPGNTYYMVIRVTTGNVGGKAIVYITAPTIAQRPPGTGDPSVTPTMHTSVDSGANWTPVPNFVMPMQVNIWQERGFGHNKVIKAAADTPANNRFGWLGFVTENCLEGQVAKVETGRRYENLFTGLTVDQIYYLTDTPGVISTTPGTWRIPVGLATSATTIIRSSQFGLPLNNVGAGTFYILGDAFVAMPQNSGDQTLTIYDPQVPGDTSYVTRASIDPEGGSFHPVPRGSAFNMEGGADNYIITPIFPS